MANLEGFRPFSYLVRTPLALVRADQEVLSLYVGPTILEQKWQVDSLALGTIGIQLRNNLSEVFSQRAT